MLCALHTYFVSKYDDFDDLILHYRSQTTLESASFKRLFLQCRSCKSHNEGKCGISDSRSFHFFGKKHKFLAEELTTALIRYSNSMTNGFFQKNLTRTAGRGKRELFVEMMDDPFDIAHSDTLMLWDR